MRDTFADALCLSACYRDRGPGIHCAKVIASQLRPAFSEGGDENAGELGGVPSGTLHLLVYVGTMEKSLAFSSTYGRGSWRTHDGTSLLAKSDTSSAEGLFTLLPRRGVLRTSRVRSSRKFAWPRSNTYERPWLRSAALKGIIETARQEGYGEPTRPGSLGPGSFFLKLLT